jgi:hypothetical protein
MNTEELKDLIQLYVDGELEKNKEPLLFASLSQDSDARDYFKSMNLLKNAIEKTGKEFPPELEKRIFYSIKDKRKKNEVFLRSSGTAKIISYSLIAILILINIYLLGRISSYSDKMNAVETVVQKQNQMIELLYNSLPATEIRAASKNQLLN